VTPAAIRVVGYGVGCQTDSSHPCALRATHVYRARGLMSTSERYRQQAALCMRASQHARTPAAKHLLMVMAQRWNDVADLAEKGAIEAEEAQAMARDLLSARKPSAA
jgi:hypothetical protein